MLKSIVMCGLIFVSAAVQAGDVAAGKAKSENCATCHGDNGKDDPPIAGMPEAAFTKAIKDFQVGARASKNKKMLKAVQDLSDGDIANLAAYYSGLK